MSVSSSTPQFIARSTDVHVAHILLGDATTCDIRNTPSVPLPRGSSVLLMYNPGDRSIIVNEDRSQSYSATTGGTRTGHASLIFPSSVHPTEEDEEGGGGGYWTSAGNKIALEANRPVTITHNAAAGPAAYGDGIITQLPDGTTISKSGGATGVSMYPQVCWGNQPGTRASVSAPSTTSTDIV